jgi:hypothetical protein
MREYGKETNSFATNRSKQAIKTVALGVLVLLLFRCRGIFRLQGFKLGFFFQGIKGIV